MIDVTVLLLNHNYASTALGPIEVFHSAGSLWNTLTAREPAEPFRVTVASIDGKPVQSPYGIALAPQTSIRDVSRADVIIVPSLGLDVDVQVARHAKMLPWLREWHDEGAYVAGVCSGTAYLAEAGLLDGRQATTHWALAETYAQRYPKVKWRSDLFITEDQRVLCSGGVYSSIDLSLHLVEKFCGHDTALECAKALLVNMPRTHQSGYAVLPLSKPHDDERIRAIEAFMAERYARDLTVERLAARASMSPRTFIRRFKKATGLMPGRYLQMLRTSVAKEMLEDGARSIQSVSSAVGYEDCAFFRTVFKRLTGMTPAEYRETFAGMALRHSAQAIVPSDRTRPPRTSSPHREG